MKNSNVILSITDYEKKLLKLEPNGCSFINFDKDQSKTVLQWLIDPESGVNLDRDEAVKAARAILDYYDEY